MARSTVHYADNATNTTLKKLHNKLRPAGTPVQRVEYIIELLLLRIFETKLKHDPEFQQLRPLFKDEYEFLLFSSLSAVPNEQILATLNTSFFPFYASILSKARKVIKGNPTIKVQDQLVLIEEVFSNSNFTNNVNSGNLQEVISLVGELDENRLLKTDLLGDAIESALSETGGTKDIGLYRTPDHVRQFMVGVVQPGFEDLIFDPACGTGGFLFDAFEYVMEGVTKNGSWPGAKTHPELAAWFREHFAAKPAVMPSVETSTDFYRNGVMGVEYLGMIRKMASINFYIRGLILPEFAVYLFNSKLGRQYFGSVPLGASPSMVKVSQDYMAGFMVPYLGNITKQSEIIEALYAHNAVLNSISSLKNEAAQLITELISQIWEH